MLNIVFTILKRKKYILITLVSAVVMGAITYYLTVVNIFHKSVVLFAEMNGLLFTIISLTLGLFIAILFGIYISLTVLRRDIIKQKALGDKVTGFGGILTGIIASGCPSCGVPLLGLIGFPLALFVLPFKGLELKVLSIMLLVISIYYLSRNIKNNLVCERQ